MKFLNFITFCTFVLGIISCGDSISNKNADSGQNRSFGKGVDSVDRYCYDDMRVSAFEFSYPTFCPSINIKVNRIFRSDTINYIVIERNGREVTYKENDSFSLFDIGQEKSMGRIKFVDSNYAILSIKCNCNR